MFNSFNAFFTFSKCSLHSSHRYSVIAGAFLLYSLHVFSLQSNILIGFFSNLDLHTSQYLSRFGSIYSFNFSWYFFLHSGQPMLFITNSIFGILNILNNSLAISIISTSAKYEFVPKTSAPIWWNSLSLPFCTFSYLYIDILYHILVGDGKLDIPFSIYALTTPAVPSGLSVILLPPLSSKVYISFCTTSVVSPTPLWKSSVFSKTGTLISLKP